MIRTDIIVLDGASAAALGVTVDVLDAANRISGQNLFEWRMLGPARVARVRGGISTPTQPLENARPRDLVIVPGLGAATEEEVSRRFAQPDAVTAATWLQRAGIKARPVAASCTGVFLLGYAGLLDERRCTTTWWLITSLASRFPRSRPDIDSMVTDDRRVWTAGASLAHIDLMLALVARFGNPVLADEVARRLIVDQRSSQARFVIPVHLASRDPLVRKVEAYVKGHVRDHLGLDDIAKAVAVAPRTLNRRITDATGMPPMKFVQKIRLDTALHALKTTRKGLHLIAEDVGFAEPSALYRLILRHTGQTPSSLRAPGNARQAHAAAAP